MTAIAPRASSHPRLDALLQRAQQRAATAPRAIGLVYAADRLALDAAAHMADARLARPLLIGPRDTILRAADEAAVDAGRFEIIDTGAAPRDAALCATALARDGVLSALMKGALHTDELISAVVNRGNGLRGNQAFMQWGRDTGTVFEPIDPTQAESYVCRYEAYLTDYRVEPRKLLWDVELSIKIAA